MERRLAAIPAVDVVGYSGLMGEDSPFVLEDMCEHRLEHIDEPISAYSVLK